MSKHGSDFKVPFRWHANEAEGNATFDIFFLSMRAGTVGIDLTQANRVVLLKTVLY